MAQTLTTTDLQNTGQSASVSDDLAQSGVSKMVENVVSLRDGTPADKLLDQRFDQFAGSKIRVDANFLSSGRRLRHRRHEINADAEVIAKHLRLPVAYLDAIEAGQWEKLPGRSFAICYVRDYARYLGLDADDLAASAKNEIAPVNTDHLFKFPEPIYGVSSSGGLVFVLSALVIGAVIAAVLYL